MTYPAPVNTSAAYAVLPALLDVTTVERILRLVTPSVASMDTEPDSVDAMPAYEMYVFPVDKEPDEVQASRASVRTSLRQLMDPIVEERITPFVRQRYPAACAKAAARLCSPCYSLVRRYTREERSTLVAHHDKHALVTVVMSLGDEGRDFTGGLYLGTSLHTRFVLPLQRGDVVVHQSDLLHGVEVTSGERWSWVLCVDGLPTLALRVGGTHGLSLSSARTTLDLAGGTAMRRAATRTQ